MHATKRERGPGGRFLSAAERGAMEQLVQMQGGGGARRGGPAPPGAPRPSAAPAAQGTGGSGPPRAAPSAGAPAEQGGMQQDGQTGGPVLPEGARAAAPAAKEEPAGRQSHRGPIEGGASAAVPTAEAGGGAGTGTSQAVSAAS